MSDLVTCGACGLTWDDSIITHLTPAPGARCPFEPFHEYEGDEPLKLDPEDIPEDFEVQPVASIQADDLDPAEPEPTEELRAAALVAWLDEEDVTTDDLVPETYDETIFDLGSREYMVLTDAEADEKAKEDIEQSLWAFNPDFLVRFLPDGVDAEVIRILQEAKYEDATEPIRAMVGDQFDDLVEDAILEDGRGHFLGRYDGHENEIEVDGIDWFIYRVN